eukprot:GFYU01001491.1.p1 GENE.GFYU01001491.1~~GFYU01001491.1.p1  ORF type:complete len:284 (+),score=38.68 GFYU01001491.1:187-1038(+)
MLSVEINDVKRVRLLVVGDSAVGKTSLVHYLCTEEPMPASSWTIGCDLDVKMHSFKDRNYFIEFYDVGGYAGYEITRDIFYNNVHGIILVHDLTNSKSYANLHKWIREVMYALENTIDQKRSQNIFSTERERDRDRDAITTPAAARQPQSQWYPTSLFNRGAGDERPLKTTELKQIHATIPLFVVGNKIDKLANTTKPRRFKLQEDFGGVEVSATMGIVDTSKFDDYFDRVVERRYFAAERPRSTETSTMRRPIKNPIDIGPSHPSYDGDSLKMRGITTNDSV